MEKIRITFIAIALLGLLQSCSETNSSTEEELQYIEAPQPYRDMPFGDPSNIGEQRTLTILATFDDMLSPEQSPALVAESIYSAENSISAYFKEISYGQTWLSGGIYGWVYIDRDSPCDYADLLNAIIEKSDEHIDFSNFDRLIIITPQKKGPNYCYSAGAGTIGKIPITTNDGTFSMSVTHVIHEGYFDLAPSRRITSFTTAHELLHNFGMWHANSTCGSGSVNLQIASSCFTQEYGNSFSIFGQYNYTLHPLVFTKEWVGWVGDDRIFTAQQNGIYTIYPTTDTLNRPIAVRIPTEAFSVNGLRSSVRSEANEIYIEYRQPVGFNKLADDSPITSSMIYDGVLVYTWTVRKNSFRRFTEEKEEPITLLFDMTPGSLEDDDEINDFSDATLRVGKSFSFESSNITIEVLSKTFDGGIDVKITFDQ